MTIFEKQQTEVLFTPAEGTPIDLAAYIAVDAAVDAAFETGDDNVDLDGQSGSLRQAVNDGIESAEVYLQTADLLDYLPIAGIQDLPATTREQRKRDWTRGAGHSSKFAR